jgi:hypothetical protein
VYYNAGVVTVKSRVIGSAPVKPGHRHVTFSIHNTELNGIQAIHIWPFLPLLVKRLQ